MSCPLVELFKKILWREYSSTCSFCRRIIREAQVAARSSTVVGSRREILLRSVVTLNLGGFSRISDGFKMYVVNGFLGPILS